MFELHASCLRSLNPRHSQCCSYSYHYDYYRHPDNSDYKRPVADYSKDRKNLT